MDEIEVFKEYVENRLKGRVLIVTVFGSVIEGKASLLSDVDVAVFPCVMSVDDRLNLVVDVMDLASQAFRVSENKVDVLFLDEDLPIELAYNALVKGVLVFCEDVDFYREFRLKVISEYLDFQVFKQKLKLFDKYLAAVKRGISSG